MTGSAMEPYDARYLSILGLSEEAANKMQQAQVYYSAALAILPIEIQALSRRFVWQVQKERLNEAVTTAETIFRRWPQYRDVIAPQLPYILSDPEGYQQIIKRFGDLPGGPVWMIRILSEDPEAALLVNRVLFDFNVDHHNAIRPEINRFTNRLIRQGKADLAYQMFLNTLDDTEKQENGYVFNGHFNLSPNGNQFDWSLRNQSGMDYSIIELENNQTGKERALQVRFLDSPVRFDSVVILTQLPPSRFKLTIDYATRSLRGPKPIRLVVDCLEARKATELTSVEFAIGGSSEQRVNTDFTIPLTGCGTQRLRLVNDNYVESWNNRYSGSLLLKSVSISRVQ
ncbi:hypothetical protein AAFN47_27060 [Hoeflea sp. CAU 1731]